ncbi:hypothetical protein CP061683_0183, partial [Chlamydia psittaci 06-1683]
LNSAFLRKDILAEST